MLETQRLLLRQWKESDLLPYSQLNANADVMRYFPSVLSQAQSDAQVERLRQIIDNNGWGFWAVELKETGQFIGFVGLHRQEQNSGIPNAPLVEIGWRLDEPFWRKGYASEAANAALNYAFTQLGVACVYAFTALPNQPSQQVMKKIGMINTNHDFDHPKIEKGHPLERHCLYRITQQQWLARHNG